MLKLPAGDYQAELITFYEDGNVKRVFPLYGQISAYWSVEEEMEQAPYYGFVIDGQVVAEGKLAGFRRIARFPQTTASDVKLIITACDGEPAVKSLSLRYAPEL